MEREVQKNKVVCFSVLQCVAVCCSVVQYVTVCCKMLQYVAVCCSVFVLLYLFIRDRVSHVAVCCGVLQCVACVAVCVCCSIYLYVTESLESLTWQCVAVC